MPRTLRALSRPSFTPVCAALACVAFICLAHLPAAAAPLARAPRQETLTGTVTAGGLNVRSGPAATAARVGRAARGETLAVLARNAGCSWLQVETEAGDLGWVSAQYVELDGACSALAVAPAAAPAGRSAPAAGGGQAGGAPGLITDFETFGRWTRGDQAWGAFTQSSADPHGGRSSGLFTYDFPATEENYLVFRRSLPIPGRPAALSMWVDGDGSGSFVNAWVEDAAGNLWQFSFGQAEHTGWQPMRAALDPNAGWPNALVEGDDAAGLVYPLTLYALVIDGTPEDARIRGRIGVDDLSTGEGAVANSGGGGSAARPPAPPARPAPPVALDTPRPYYPNDGDSFDYPGPDVMWWLPVEGADSYEVNLCVTVCGPDRWQEPVTGADYWDHPMCAAPVCGTSQHFDGETERACCFDDVGESKYEWRVRALAGDAAGEWSAPATFTLTRRPGAGAGGENGGGNGGETGAPAPPANGEVVEITDANFGEVIAGPLPVLMLYWAPWCGPCRAADPALEQLAQEFAGRAVVARLDVDEYLSISEYYGYPIAGVPTFSLFAGGGLAEQREGAQPGAELQAWLAQWAE